MVPRLAWDNANICLHSTADEINAQNYCQHLEIQPKNSGASRQCRQIFTAKLILFWEVFAKTQISLSYENFPVRIFHRMIEDVQGKGINFADSFHSTDSDCSVS